MEGQDLVRRTSPYLDEPGLDRAHGPFSEFFAPADWVDQVRAGADNSARARCHRGGRGRIALTRLISTTLTPLRWRSGAIDTDPIRFMLR